MGEPLPLPAGHGQPDVVEADDVDVLDFVDLDEWLQPAETEHCIEDGFGDVFLEVWAPRLFAAAGVVIDARADEFSGVFPGELFAVVVGEVDVGLAGVGEDLRDSVAELGHCVPGDAALIFESDVGCPAARCP